MLKKEEREQVALSRVRWAWYEADRFLGGKELQMHYENRARLAALLLNELRHAEGSSE
jgi:hypothetical protein